MRIVPSNSGCCGVKYIRDFPGPYLLMSAISRCEYNGYNDEGSTTEPDDPYECLYCGDAPKETALERFDRFVSFLKETRPSGCIEVYLAPVGVLPGECEGCGCSVHCNQYNLWKPLLLERGWKELDTFINSNSDNEVGHFVLKY